VPLSPSSNGLALFQFKNRQPSVAIIFTILYSWAFDTIIETRVWENKERLYFLNKNTTEKTNDVNKDFVTLSFGDNYKQAKNLLAQRFGDLHPISNAYKSRLKNWPQIAKVRIMVLRLFETFWRVWRSYEKYEVSEWFGLRRIAERSQLQASLIFRS